MSLYIKTEDYRKHGINKYSDLALIRAVVQEELKMDRVFVSFVNRHEYIRVDFCSRGRHGGQGGATSRGKRWPNPARHDQRALLRAPFLFAQLAG